MYYLVFSSSFDPNVTLINNFQEFIKDIGRIVLLNRKHKTTSFTGVFRPYAIPCEEIFLQSNTPMGKNIYINGNKVEPTKKFSNYKALFSRKDFIHWENIISWDYPFRFGEVLKLLPVIGKYNKKLTINEIEKINEKYSNDSHLHDNEKGNYLLLNESGHLLLTVKIQINLLLI